MKDEKTGNDLKVHSIRIKEPSSIELYLPEVCQSLVCIISRVNNVEQKKMCNLRKAIILKSIFVYFSLKDQQDEMKFI